MCFQCVLFYHSGFKVTLRQWLAFAQEPVFIQVKPLVLLSKHRLQRVTAASQHFRIVPGAMGLQSMCSGAELPAELAA